MKPRTLLFFALLGTAPKLALGAEPWKVIRPQWGAPAPRFFVSSEGRFALKVAPNGAAAVAALVTLDATGAERELWRRELPSFPVDALIAGRNAPFVALFDAWGRAGQEHSLAIYSPNGQLVRDFALEDLLTPDEIAARVQSAGNDRWWREGAQATLLGGDPPALRLDFPFGKTLIVDLSTGRTPLLSEIRDAVPLQALALSGDGAILATGADEPPVKLWDAATGRLRQTLDTAAGSAATLAFSSEGQALAAARDGALTLWDAATGMPRPFTIKPVHAVASAAFSPDGKLVATGQAPGRFRPGDGQIEGEVKLWDTATGAPRLTLRWQESEPPRGARATPNDATAAVAFSSDGDTLAGGIWRGVALWDTATGEMRRLWTTGSPVMALAYAPDGRVLAAGRQDGTVQLFDTTAGTSRGSLAGFNGQGGVAFSPDGRWLAATAVNNEVRVWDARTLKIKTTLRGHTAFVTALAFDTDSNVLYSSSEDRTVKVWKVE